MRKSAIITIAAVSLLGAGLAACGNDGGSQRTKGEVKETVGSITGDESMKREGQKDQVVGGVRETVDDAKDAIKDATK